MIFVDSSVLIDYFNGKENWQVEKFDEMLGKEIIVTGDYILVEVLQGFRNDKDYETAKNVLNAFPCFSICGEEIAIKSAVNYRMLRKKGITIRKTLDIIIGTFCIENELILLHNDKDFFPLEKHLGLKTVILKSS
ncbi:MAG: PIN domain nuclease [Chlorobi bacterium]|nr:PIN domain nuclease [Ignavibacteriota bacterium]MBL1161192.1 PIN domain nuclease [Chlorobiota bacterium]MCO6446323.1 PIN domain nuclease [Ignavibacterium album]MCZ2268648.1 PIN domain nuclease [Ignavibacteriales bacterium]HOJ06178.1 PIN domain nuclease [Ignavibacteriaceae bacterium]